VGTEHLEFLLNLDTKLDGMIEGLAAIDKTTKALNALDRSAAKMTAGVDKLDKVSHHAAGAHAKHAAGALNLGHAFEGAKNKAHGLLEAMGLIVVFEGLEKIAEKVMEIGSEMIHAAAKAQSFDNSFKLALGAEGGKELLEHIEKIAKFTDKTDDELKGIAGSLVRVGFAGEGLDRALAAAGDLGALPAGNMEDSIRALSEIKRRGVVTDRLLQPLGIGEKEFFKELSGELGLGVETIKKRIEKGTLDTEVVLELLYKKINAKTNMPLGAGMVEKSKELGSRLKHLGDMPDQFMQKLSRTEGFERFSNIIGKLLVQLDPESPAGKKIFDNLDKAFTKFVDVLAKIDTEKLSRDLITLFERLPPLITATTEALLKLISVMGRSSGMTGPVVGPGGHAIDRSAPVTVKNAATIGAFKNLEMSPDQQKDIAGFQNWAKKWLHIGSGASEAMSKGMLEEADKVAGAGTKVGEAAGGAAAAALDAHSPSRVFERLGRMSGEGYVQGLEQSADKIDDAVQRTLGMNDSVPVGSFAAPAGGAPFGPIQVAVNITTNVGGGGAGADGEAAGEAIGEQVAQHVEAILPSALQSAFERMGQEAGS
jgi:hypothetical protein